MFRPKPLQRKLLLGMTKIPAITPSLPPVDEKKVNTNSWLYFNLDFTPRKNPKKEINKGNKHQRKLKNFKSASDHTDKIDYLAFNTGLNTGIAELWGDRTYQEDKAIAEQLVDFEKVPEEKRKLVLKGYAANLQTLINQKKISGGSTLNTTVICGNKIYNAHVGDTDCYLVIVHADGNVSLKRLNKRHHHPNKKKERERLLSEDKWQFVRNNRLYNQETRHSYANSRGMGDNHLEKYGLSHKVETSTTPLELQEGEDAFVVTMCDGLAKLSKEKLTAIIKENRTEPPHKIAKALVNAAKALVESKKAEQKQNEPLTGFTGFLQSLFSTPQKKKKIRSDNMTAMVTKVRVHAPTQYQAMFDGHTNSNVSNFLYGNSTEAFNAAIQNHLDVAVEENASPTAVLAP